MKMNKNALKIFSIVLGVILISGCGPARQTKAEMFPLMYSEAPRSILILPPINLSTAANAKEYYSTTIQEPLAYKGYYVYPYEVTSEILKQEGIYDTELLTNVPLNKFREYFGADAVLFTTIKRWDLRYLVIGANLVIQIEAKMKSTKSDQELWRYTGTVVVDLSGGNSGGGIAGLIAKAIVTAVNTAIVDYVPHARTANYRAMSSMPVGKYHNQYNKDQNVQIIVQAAPKKESGK